MSDSNDMRLQMTFQAQKKSTAAAYLLWFFLGGFGAHRFYLGQTGTAITQLLMSIFGWLTVWFAVGLLLLIPLGIWLLVDAFLIPGIIEQQNMKLVNTLTGQPMGTAMGIGPGSSIDSGPRTPASIVPDSDLDRTY